MSTGISGDTTFQVSGCISFHLSGQILLNTSGRFSLRIPRGILFRIPEEVPFRIQGFTATNLRRNFVLSLWIREKPFCAPRVLPFKSQGRFRSKFNKRGWRIITMVFVSLFLYGIIFQTVFLKAITRPRSESQNQFQWKLSSKFHTRFRSESQE